MSLIPFPTRDDLAHFFSRHPVLQSLLLLVVDHNPFYVLSALCMLAGCLTLTNTTTYSPIKPGQLLALIATLNAYELLLVSLGLYLIARRRIRRDGMFLLLIELLFLVDMAFLNAEAYSLSPRLGLLVNLIVFALAAAKLFALFRVLKFPLNDGLFPFTLLQLFVLSATPGFFAHAAFPHDGRLSPWLMYAAWWALGLMPALYVFMVRPRNLITSRVGDPVRDVLTKVLLWAPLISGVVHLGTSHWVFKLDFVLADAAPLLLGFAVAIGHHDSHVSTYARRARAQLLFPALALLFSTTYPNSLLFAAPGPDWSPLRIALLAAALIYVDGAWSHHHPLFACAAGLCSLAFGLGPSVTEMKHTTELAADETQSLLDRLTPRTPHAWGILSVSASFILLAIGFGLSLLRPHLFVAPLEIPNDTQDSNSL